MKRMLVMLGWMNIGGTRQPAGKWSQVLLAAALVLLLGAWAAPIAAGEIGQWTGSLPAEIILTNELPPIGWTGFRLK